MKNAWKYSRGRPRQGWSNSIKNKNLEVLQDTQRLGMHPI
jgi:hypothetical protein